MHYEYTHACVYECICACSAKLQSLSRMLSKVKSDKQKEIEELEQGEMKTLHKLMIFYS